MIDDAEALRLQDPALPAHELAAVANARPDLLPIVARHPAAYPELLEWLRGFGDPSIDAALAQRAAHGGYGFALQSYAAVRQPSAVEPGMAAPTGSSLVEVPRTVSRRTRLVGGVVAASVLLVGGGIAIGAKLVTSGEARKPAASGGVSRSASPDGSAAPTVDGSLVPSATGTAAPANATWHEAKLVPYDAATHVSWERSFTNLEWAVNIGPGLALLFMPDGSEALTTVTLFDTFAGVERWSIVSPVHLATGRGYWAGQNGAHVVFGDGHTRRVGFAAGSLGAAASVALATGETVSTLEGDFQVLGHDARGESVPTMVDGDLVVERTSTGTLERVPLDDLQASRWSIPVVGDDPDAREALVTDTYAVLGSRTILDLASGQVAGQLPGDVRESYHSGVVEVDRDLVYLTSDDVIGRVTPGNDAPHWEISVPESRDLTVGEGRVLFRTPTDTVVVLDALTGSEIERIQGPLTPEPTEDEVNGDRVVVQDLSLSDSGYVVMSSERTPLMLRKLDAVGTAPLLLPDLRYLVDDGARLVGVDEWHDGDGETTGGLSLRTIDPGTGETALLANVSGEIWPLGGRLVSVEDLRNDDGVESRRITTLDGPSA